MTLVVDASVAAKWFVEETGSEAAVALLDLGPELLAPDLLLAEVANVAWKKLRRGEIAPHHLQVPVHWVRTGVPRLVPIGSLIEEAIAITVELDHPIYDCVYLALAVRSEAPLITADRRLQGRVAGTRFETRVRPLVESNAH